MNKKIVIAASILAGLLTVSCTEEIVVDKIDESAFENVISLKGFLRDHNSNKTNNLVELRSEPYETELQFGLNRAPSEAVDVKVSYDAAYLEEYNKVHETDFILYPEDKVEFDNNGEIVVAPDQKYSYTLSMKISPAADLEEGKTYVVPVKAVSSTEGIDVVSSHAHCLYFVKDRSKAPWTDKGEDAVKTFLYFEVNDVNPLNAGTIITESGKSFFDYVCLFAANINYDKSTGEVFVNCNENVQYLLDHREQFLKPLQKMGTKVILGLLGNHDESGLAQLSEKGAKEFAKKLKEVCDAYELDGVNFDDEYSNAPDLSNPLFAPKSRKAAARLVYETKNVMPDKHVSVYAYGAMYGESQVDGVDASEWIDAAVADYWQIARPVGNMTLKQCSGLSWQMNYMPTGFADRDIEYCVEGGYGYCMMFAMYNNSDKRSQISALSRMSEILYGEPIRPVDSWYRKNSVELVKF